MSENGDRRQQSDRRKKVRREDAKPFKGEDRRKQDRRVTPDRRAKK
jgi:hypothetical protein